MSELLLAHRFRRIEALDEGNDVSLLVARDVAAEENGWLLRLVGREFAAAETAVRTRLLRFAALPLFRSHPPRAVVSIDNALNLLLDAHPAPAWAQHLESISPTDVRAELETLHRALVDFVAAGMPAGGVALTRLRRDSDGPFLLPTACLVALQPADDFCLLEEHDPGRAHAEAVRLWEEAVAAALRRVDPESGAELEAWSEARASALTPSRPRDSSIAEAVGRVASTGGSVLLRGLRRVADPADLTHQLPTPVTLVRLRPFVRPRISRRVAKDRHVLVLLEDARALAPFAESLDRLATGGWTDGKETMVFCVGEGIEDESLRLFLGARRKRSGTRTEELDVAGEPRPSDTRETIDGLDRRLLEALTVAGRPLSDRLLADAFSLSSSAMAERAVRLALAGEVELLFGCHDEAGAGTCLIVDPGLGAEVHGVGEDRRREIGLLLGSSLESLDVRGGLGRGWLRAEAALHTGSERAAQLWRTVIRRAEKDGLALTAYAAHQRLLAEAAQTRPRLEDHCRAAICMGEQHQLQGEVECADQILTHALEVLEDGAAGQAERIAPLACDLVLKLVQLDLHRSSFQSAERRLTEVLERYKDHLPAIHRARVYLDLSWALLQLGRTRECMGYCELTLRILDVERHPDIVARAYNQLGFAQYKESDYARSIVNYQRSLVLRQQVGDELAVARSYNNLALSHRALGQLREAERCLQQSLELKRKAGENLGVATSLLNLGFVYLDQGRWSDARERAKECLELARELQRLETEAEAYGLLGEVAMGEGRIVPARELLERDLRICEATDHQSERLATLRRLVSVLLALDELDEAARRLEEAGRLLSEQPSRYEAAMLGRLEAELLARSGALEPAIDGYAAAARVFGTLQRHESQLECLAHKGTLEDELGWTRRARATLAELRDLIGRHELHRVPDEVRSLEHRLGRVTDEFEAPTADRCLAALAEVLSAGGEVEGGRPETALRAVLTTLEGEEILWLLGRERVLSHLVPGGHATGGPPTELSRAIDESAASPTTERVQRGAWSAVRVGGIQPGWLAVLRPHPLDAHEFDLLRSAAGVLALLQSPPSPGASSELDGLPVVEDGTPGHGMVGRSDALRETLRTVDMVRDNDVTVLLLGENGTGKDMVAQAIHRSGRRGDAEFVAVNCASIPPTLLESELFGHEKGAFTNAYERRIGVFERANGGTIFLDEIGEIPLAMQAKLLRVLQDHSFTRVGGAETLASDVRVIAATNRDLLEEVRQGRFRMDLYYRLNVVSMEIPPLRKRVEDIEPLVEHFLRRHAAEFASPVVGIAQEALARLQEYEWPGNVRELENVIKNALVFARSETLRLEDLPSSILVGRAAPAGQSIEDAVRAIIDSEDWSEERPLLPRVELLLVHEAVRLIGNKTRAAKRLGITKPTLYNRLRRFQALYGDSGEEDPR